MLETGHRLDPRGNYQASGKIPYRKSELRLLEALEQVCAGMYAYDLQDDDKSAFRYHRKRNLGALAELMSQLSSTTNKLGISNNMETLIDPRGDLKVLKTKCSGLIEDYEDDITEWYMSHQDKTDLTDYLCAQRVAKKDHECLTQRLIDTFDKTDDKEIDDDDDDDDEEEIDADTEDEGQETSDATDASNEGNTDEDSNETTDKHTEL
ncbi:protein canopy homolog 3-like isoform X2 [Corticium candelabrum]|nr:protein canopy homolog 3-like isoform X2 [Corticium candelabrum]